MQFLENYFGFTPAVLQRVGAFVVFWGIFESYLELATLALMGEKLEKDQRPRTDCLQATQLIAQFRSSSDKYIPEVIEAVRKVSETADDLLVFRNAIMHGRAIPPPAGGPKFINNAAWFGEKRKRPVSEAHINERLLDMAIECATGLSAATFTIHMAALEPKENQLVFVSQIMAKIRAASSQANELRHLAALMNSEKY